MALASSGLIGTQAGPLATSVAQLRTDLKGELITPESADYDLARVGLSREIVRRPGLIVRPMDAIDVSHAVSFARETGMELAIRSGGHSLDGFGTSEGGLVLDLSSMRGLEINVGERTAWAEAGLTAGEYSVEADKYGLATGFGDTATVGIGGLTTGGGIGYLVRKHGLTIDNLLAAQVVTADGQIRHVDAETHPDLFWAIRGGGGNFGVVTHFKFRLVEANSMVGGMLILPATPQVLAGFAAEAEAAPEELSAIVSIMAAPPMPQIPAELHGQIVALAMLVYTGEAEAGRRALAPFRKLAEPLVDLLGPMRYPDVYIFEDPNWHPLAALRSKLIDRVDEQVAHVMLDYLRMPTTAMRLAEFRVLGGAMARVPAEATAFAHRSSRVMASFIVQYEDRNEADVHNRWVNDAAAALGWNKGPVYVNFLADGDTLSDAYPKATLQRLAAIKAQYDPENLFRRNQNIQPRF